MMSVILGDVDVEGDGGGDKGAHRRPKPHRSKRSLACNHCRLKKVKCNGDQPICANCRDRGERCVYQPLKRRTRNEGHGNNDLLLDRIEKMEVALKEANAAAASRAFCDPSRDMMAAEGLRAMSASMPVHIEKQPRPSLPSPSPTELSSQLLQWAPTSLVSTENAGMSYRQSSPAPGNNNSYEHTVDHSPPATSGTSNSQNYQEHLLASSGSINDGTQTHSYTGSQTPQIDPSLKEHEDKEGTDSIPCPENSDWEYHGPGSFLTICSKPGVQWVADRTGSSDFAAIAKTFSRDTTRPLKLSRKISTERAPEPDHETAWRYTRAYFERTPEAAFNIVIRSAFEGRLQAFLENGNPSAQDEDAAWYALRNTIYAYGCRTELSEDRYASNFQQPQIAGWKYFENALSRHTELLFCRTGLMAVQALIAMALYTEGIACASLEYMLCSGALRLAQSKGLHRQAGSAWGMSPQEIQHRNWLFWIIYSYEKHIAHRSGRASAIDDDEISCHVPTSVPAGNANHLELCTHLIKHAQICSQIGKSYCTVKAYRQSPQEMMKKASDLDQMLRTWRDSIPTNMRPGSVINSSKIPENLTIIHVVYLHYSYFGSLICIHSMFTYPWSSILGRERDEGLRKQIQVSTDIVAEASRNIILATKYVNDVYAWTPVWLEFYYPVLGLINLFVHVLKHPTAPSVTSDIALMDVVAGHFARLEFASGGELAFSFAREVSNLARLAVKEAQKRLLSEKSQSSFQLNDTLNAFHMDTGYLQYSQNALMQNQALSFDHMDNVQMSDFDLENWSALLPSFSPQEMIDLDGMPTDYDVPLPPD